VIDELTGIKWVSPEKMTEIMKDLPTDSMVAVNKVGNLSAYNKKWEFIGYVDLSTEEWTYAQPPFKSILENPL